MDELRLRIEKMIKKIEEETEKRGMNDIECSRWETLRDVIDIMDELRL